MERNKVAALCAALVVVAGCFGGGSDGGGSLCGPPEGAYELSTQELSGDCGDLPTMVVTLVGEVRFARSTQDCTVVNNVSSDRCDSEVSAVCDLEMGGTLTIAGAVSATDDSGDRYEGTWTVRIDNSPDVSNCLSELAVTYQKVGA